MRNNEFNWSGLIITENSHHRASIDQALINMIVTDMQPVSIVEDKGFNKFVKVLDPKYSTPSRRTIMREHLPKMFEKNKNNSWRNSPT